MFFAEDMKRLKDQMGLMEAIVFLCVLRAFAVHSFTPRPSWPVVTVGETSDQLSCFVHDASSIEFADIEEWTGDLEFVSESGRIVQFYLGLSS